MFENNVNEAGDNKPNSNELMRQACERTNLNHPELANQLQAVFTYIDTITPSTDPKQIAIDLKKIGPFQFLAEYTDPLDNLFDTTHLTFPMETSEIRFLLDTNSLNPDNIKDFTYSGSGIWNINEAEDDALQITDTGRVWLCKRILDAMTAITTTNKDELQNVVSCLHPILRFGTDGIGTADLKAVLLAPLIYKITKDHGADAESALGSIAAFIRNYDYPSIETYKSLSKLFTTLKAFDITESERIADFFGNEVASRTIPSSK
jgi:hypothetical protein